VNFLIARERKTGIPTNKEALLILEADLKTVGKKRVTVSGLLEALNLVSNIQALKQDSKLTILI